MTTKVAFVKDIVDGDIIAVFPEEPHSRYGSDVVMYVHMGQHTNGSIEWALDQDEPSYSEMIDLFNELVRVGYDDLMLVEL